MATQRLHSDIVRKAQWNTLVAVLCLCFLAPAPLMAQGDMPLEQRLTVIAQRALDDAAYEYRMQWRTEEDELDYWTDQRNFEKHLRGQFLEGYHAYLSNKRRAYIKLEAHCDGSCEHGEHFERHAAFYIQYENPAQSADAIIATSASH